MVYELNHELAQSFEKRFGYEPAKLYFSPGRVNLIGEHTDYNGGHVFPAAISVGTYGAIAHVMIKRFAPIQRTSQRLGFN